ncbi:TPA: nucleotidyltransferase domain-containing protein [Candidatus Woesearchaeota archaeon]|nr:nucleotidyltransferase domain-containing protein [Candidatus Woesearchaeota archaeon]
MFKKTYRVLGVFADNPTITYIFSEIRDYVGNKSEGYTHTSLMNFVKEGVLTKEKKGGLGIYKIAFAPKAISYLSMVAEHKAWSFKKFPSTSIHDLVEQMNIDFFTLLVTGSYAKGKQTQKSDIDIILIVPAEASKIRARLQHHCEMNIPTIHLYTFTSDEFKQMLLDKKHNYGKEAVKNNLIFYGAEAYYKLLFEVMKRGFTY